MNLRSARKSGRQRPVVPTGSFPALNAKRPVVHAAPNPDTSKRAVLVLSPECAPLAQQLVAVPLPGLDRPQSRRRRLPQGQQDMGMVIVRMIPFFQYRLMDRHIRHHAAAHERLLNEV